MINAHRPSHEVIAVGLEQRRDCGPLVEQLQSLGLALVSAPDGDPLTRLLAQERGATVIVYSPRAADRAARVLDALHENGCGGAVVVLTDQADFGQYCDLMGRGAAAYVALSDSPEQIVRAVRRAAGA